jgi:hypothetical protein
MVIGQVTVISMLQLFVAPTPFEGWGEYPHDGTLRLIVIVSVGALALTLCVALLMLFADDPLGPPDQSRFPIPACLISFAAWRATSVKVRDTEGRRDLPRKGCQHLPTIC